MQEAAAHGTVECVVAREAELCAVMELLAPLADAEFQATHARVISSTYH